MTTLVSQSASAIVEQLNSGVVTPHELLDNVKARIDQVNPIINALPTLCFDRARQHADRLMLLNPKDRGPLCGLPVTIKDLTDVEGVTTSYGCTLFANNRPVKSDQMVQKIESLGGIIYAKSNTPEFGTGGISFNAVFGETLSPRNTIYASGGSSGGAAASLGSGCAWLSHGSDMAGSLRTPAAFCGVTSLRPSPGRIRSDSAYLPFDILGTEGPMARNIFDLGLFADILFGSSEHSSVLQHAAGNPEKPKRVAFSESLGITTVTNAAAAGMEKVISALSTAGVKTFNAHPPLAQVHNVFDTLRAHGYAINLEKLAQQNPGAMKPEIEWNIRHGLSLTTEQLRSATRAQGEIINQAAQFMEQYDVLVCPATSVTKVPAGLHYPGEDSGVAIPEYYRWLAIAYATTVTALPIITLPVGLDDDGMPMAVQLVGKPYGETALLQSARFIETLCDFDSTPIDPVIVHH